MTDISDIKHLVEEMGGNVLQLKNSYDGRFADLAARLDDIQLKAARPGAGIFGGDKGELSEAQRKSLDRGARALIAGDQQAAERHFVEAKAMSAGTDPAGGYMVVPQMSREMTRVELEVSPILGEVRSIDLDATDEFEELIDRDEAGVSWVGELDPRSATDTPDLGKFAVPLHEVYAQPQVSQKLIDTASYNVMDWLVGKVGEKFGHAFGAAIVSGDGAKPAGFLTMSIAATADASRSWNVLQYLPTGTSGDFNSSTKTDVLVDTVAALKPQYRRGAKWAMNRATAAKIRKLKDADGNSLWANSMQEGQPDRLLGYPVIEDDNMPDVAANSLSIAFGNFRKGYTLVRRLGTRFLVDPYSAKPKVLLYAYQRIGGAVNNSEAIKLVRFSAS